MERGLKMTGQRRVIARVLSEAHDHPDVEELYRRASALDGRISVATVYRTSACWKKTAFSNAVILAAAARATRPRRKATTTT